MSAERTIVITAYGHDKTIDKITVSSFDGSNHYGNDSDAGTYCKTINSLELNGNSWVFAKIVSENTLYSLESFLPLKFDILLKLDDEAVQKVLREVDFLSQDIAIALKGEKENVQERIFRNMSKRASLMLKEDMEYIGPVLITDVKERQRKIIAIIRHLEETGEIVICSKGETLE